MKKCLSEKEIATFLKTLSKNNASVVLKRNQIENILMFNLKIIDYYIMRIEKDKNKIAIDINMKIIYTELNRKKNEILACLFNNK